MLMMNSKSVWLIHTCDVFSRRIYKIPKECTYSVLGMEQIFVHVLFLFFFMSRRI